MQSSAPPIGPVNEQQQQQQQQQHQQQHQPTLPSYAEATGTPAPTNLPSMYSVGEHVFYPSGPVYGPQAVPVHIQSGQLNYANVPVAANGFAYPPTYTTTNAYPQYGRTDLDVPTTIHIIRPQPVEPACCSSTSCRLLGIFIGAAFFCAMLRSAISSHL